MSQEYKGVRNIVIFSPAVTGLEMTSADLGYFLTLKPGTVLFDFYQIEPDYRACVIDDFDLSEPFPDLLIVRSANALLPETYTDHLGKIILAAKLRDLLESGVAFEFIDNKNIGFSAWVKTHPVIFHVNDTVPNMHFTQTQRESILAHLNSASKIFEDSVKNSASPNDYVDDCNEMAAFIFEQIRHYDQVVDQYEKNRSVAATFKRKARGGYVGVKKGDSRITQKEEYALPRIVAWSASFEGDWSDSEIIHRMHIKSDTFKKYKAEILELQQNHRGKYLELCDAGKIIKQREGVIKKFDREVDYRKKNKELGLTLTTRLLRTSNSNRGQE